MCNRKIRKKIENIRKKTGLPSKTAKILAWRDCCSMPCSWGLRVRSKVLEAEPLGIGQGTEIPSQIKILPKKVAGVGQGRQEQCMTFTEPSTNTLCQWRYHLIGTGELIIFPPDSGLSALCWFGELQERTSSACYLQEPGATLKANKAFQRCPADFGLSWTKGTLLGSVSAHKAARSWLTLFFCSSVGRGSKEGCWRSSGTQTALV